MDAIKHEVTVNDCDLTVYFRDNGKTISHKEQFKASVWFNQSHGMEKYGYIPFGPVVTNGIDNAGYWLRTWEQNKWQRLGTRVVLWVNFVGADVKEIPRVQVVEEKPPLPCTDDPK